MTDNTLHAECGIVHCFYFLATIILVATGLIHGPDVLFYIGAGLFLLPFAVWILAFAGAPLALTVWGVVLLVKHPSAGVPVAMVFVGFNLIMIATHGCSASFFFLFFGCFSARAIPIWICSIWYLCRTSYYQRKAVVLEALVVNRFTEENNSEENNLSLGYYWVGEYEAPSLQYVKLNSDEKQTAIQLFHNGDQQGAEKNGLEECCKEEEEVCYKMQQRFQKKFLVTEDLYHAASLELLVLPGRPNQAMLTNPLYYKRREAKSVSIILFFIASGFSVPGFVIPLKIWIANDNDNDRLDDVPFPLCTQIVWQTYVPYISLLLMVMLLQVIGFGMNTKRGNLKPWQGAEKNGLEECCKEEEEVCYKMQQRFQKKFLVTEDLYQAASLELLVLPGRPNQAMLTKPLEDKRRDAKVLSIFCFFFSGMFSVPGIVIPLKILIASRSDIYGPDDLLMCSQIVWQTYVPYVSLLLIVILLVSYGLWNEYQKGEFEAVTVHPAGEQELTVVGPQKKKEDEYHHINDDATACTRELDYDDETVCTRELDNDGETACSREPVGTGRNRAFLV
eukprot:CAMPEP_0198276298 /NCGR_PEP_ID=MMETSP1447-20131203/65236_1 /TAXON_ID=420782 /ORGANISM="Chaetoceros dichaeta, Strain CCMP1751" /LENGTH=561 /DNA_ID=CAMNT_0043971237 /DNA_START=623 /DNA_END=2309 /DNA_ORIENTATION=-